MALQQTQVLPAQFIQDVGQDYAKQLTAATAAPLPTQQFAPSVAGQTALQQQATGLAGTGIGAYQPYLTGAATATQAPGAAPLGLEAYGTMGGAAGLTGTGVGTGAGSISSYMSPYQSQVIDTSLAEFDRQSQMRQQQMQDATLGVPGAFGGGREGVQLAEYQTGSDRQRANLQAGLLQQGYGVGQQARQQDMMNQLTLGGAQAGLAQGQMGLGTYQQGLASLTPQLAGGDIGTLSQMGGVQQQQSQNVLNAQQQANQMAAMEPYQRMGVYGQGVGQLAQMPGQISTQQTQDPTALQTALGWTGVMGGIMNPRLGTTSS